MEILSNNRGMIIGGIGFELLGGGEGEVKPKGKKKFITREEEPEQ